MIAAEQTKTGMLSEEERLIVAMEKLEARNISRIAIAGAQGSDDEALAIALRPQVIDYYGTYHEVVKACAESDVAALIPVLLPTGQKLGNNLALCIEAGSASIASLTNPMNGTVNKLLIANPNP